MSPPRQPLYDRLLEQLKDPDISELIRQKDGTRIFDDLPDRYGEKFDWLLANAKTDIITLKSLLKEIGKVYHDTDHGPCFTYLEDANAIRLWAKEIIRHAANELLDESNHIKYELLQSLHKNPINFSGHELLYAFFATYSAHILTIIIHSPDYKYIKPEVFQAMNLLLGECSSWIDEICSKIEQPAASPNPPHTHHRKTAVLSGIAVGTVLFFGSVAAAYVFAESSPEKDREKRLGYQHDY